MRFATLGMDSQSNTRSQRAVTEVSELGLNLLLCSGIAGAMVLLGRADFWQNFITILWFSLPIHLLSAALYISRVEVTRAAEVGVPLLVGITLGCWHITQQPAPMEGADTIAFMVVGSMLATLITLFFWARKRVRISKQELHQQQLRRVEAEKDLAVSELNTLQAQIEPHFLFNTLANIQSLISVDADKAQVMLNHLTQMLRNSLQRSRELQSNLGQELALIRHYLEIQKIRLGERLEFDIQVVSGLENVELPPLLIQPIVENALQHGIEPAIEGGVVSVLVTRQDDKLAVTVVDTGVGLGNSPSKGTGLGLANVRQRLQSLYGEEARMVLAENRPKGTRVTLLLPALAATNTQH
ncbi:sensor histidine kinase [Paraferrimonas sedimenticola]|nr:sensor histidine kinase [Paraferrimonas sedimenticola]